MFIDLADTFDLQYDELANIVKKVDDRGIKTHRYRNEGYGSINKKDLRFINARLNKGLLSFYGYNLQK